MRLWEVLTSMAVHLGQYLSRTCRVSLCMLSLKLTIHCNRVTLKAQSGTTRVSLFGGSIALSTFEKKQLI